MAFLIKNSRILVARKMAITAGLLVIVIFGAEFAIPPGLERGVAQIRADEHEQSIGSSDIPFGNVAIAENEDTDARPVYFLTSPAVIGGCGVDSSRPDGRSNACKSSSDFNLNLQHELTTTAVISPDKAQEFTLVGAKPSGTS